MSTVPTSNTSQSPLQASVGPTTLAPILEKRYPATEAQLEIWLSSLQSPAANCSYNEISSLILGGQLNVEAIEQALGQVAMRNAALRTTFSSDGQYAQVMAGSNHEFRFIDLSEMSNTDSQTAQDALIHEEANKPFDLERGPLLRCVLQRISTTQHKLTLSAHHIIMDGWSLAVVGRDLGKCYDASVQGTQVELPPVIRYEDYAEKMKAYYASEQGKSDETFWTGQFADSIPVLDLPITGKRPALRTYAGARHDHVLPSTLVERARKVGAKSGCSLFNVMLSAFSAYVARISGNDDFCIGIPTAGQAAMDQLDLVGHCVNALPWRTQVDFDAPFSTYMKSSRSTLLDALDHQCYSYGTLLRKLAPPRDPSRAPMLSVSFNVDPTIDTSEMGFSELTLDFLIEPRSFENFEWFVNGVIRKDKSVEMQVQYNSDLFSAEAMQFYFEGFQTFLSGMVDSPETPVSSLPVVSVEQRQRMIVDFNRTDLEYPTTSTLAAEFSRQAAATPNKTAVVFKDESLTYQQVETRSNQIARYLISQGIGAKDLVGICVNRSEQMLVNLYAIAKTGAGYVPLDPAYPADRLQYMCDHSKLKLVVTQSDLVQQVEAFGKPLIVIDGATEEIDQQSSSPVDCPANPADICYVIYTSGSTGKPKGVQVPHGAVVNFLYSMKQQPGFNADDSLLAVTTLSFDIAVLELYLPSIFGGKVVIVDSLTATDGNKLAEEVDRHDISLLQATPATWRLMIGAGWQGKSDLKVLCGGEPMPPDLVAPLLARCGQLWNMYGPTETTVWSAVYQVTDPVAPILIGKPIGNTQIYILDEQGREVPIGCQGEVFIGGAGVTTGYRNRQDLTDERFIANRYRNPFAQYVSDKIYKTGDLARYRFDGNIEFLRRNDKQVKVRGFRIELGEIESILKSHPAIEHNVVIVRQDTLGDARLVAYSIFKDGQQATTAELKDHLRATLPYYMIPQNFVTLDVMPQTNNGKIDYNALPAPQVDTNSAGDADDDQDLAAPQTPAEIFLAGVWAETLETDRIDLNDNFFDIGGHSLLVMRVIAAVKAETGFTLGPQDFLIGTLEQLADKFSDQYCVVAETADAAGDAMPASEKTAGAVQQEQPVETSNQASTTSSPTANPTDKSNQMDKSNPMDESNPSYSGNGSQDGASEVDMDEPSEKWVLKSLKGFWQR